MRRFADTVAERMAVDPKFREAVAELDAEPVCGSASDSTPCDLEPQCAE
jgi:hypothetical protein